MTVKIFVSASAEPFTADVSFPDGVPKGGCLTLVVGNQNETSDYGYIVQDTALTSNGAVSVLPVVRKSCTDVSEGLYRNSIFARQESNIRDKDQYSCIIQVHPHLQQNDLTSSVSKQKRKRKHEAVTDLTGKGKKYKCSLCSFAAFYDKDEVAQHEDLHKGYGFTCVVCKAKFKCHQDLQVHFRDHLSQTYSCSNCLTKFNNSEFYQRHIKRCKKIIECANCREGFESTLTYISHIKECGKRAQDQTLQATSTGRKKPLVVRVSQDAKASTDSRAFEKTVQTASSKKQTLDFKVKTSEPQELVVEILRDASIKTEPPDNFSESSNESFMQSQHSSTKVIPPPPSLRQYNVEILEEFHLQGEDAESVDEPSETQEFEILQEQDNSISEKSPLIVKIVSPASKLQCSFCTIVFNSEKTFESHLRRNHRDQAAFECEDCKRKFFTESSFEQHSEICRKRTRRQKSENRLDLHPGKGRQGRQGIPIQLQCDVCPVNFSSYKELTDHVKFDHPENDLYACTECDDMFAHLVFLLSHQAMHEKSRQAEGWNQCRLCTKMFRSLAELQNHLMCHCASKLFKCSTCDVLFRSRCNLITHTKLHQPNIYDTAFPCNQCGKSFSTPNKLKKHVRQSHVRDFKYICRICYKKYRTHHLLQVHLGMAHYSELSPSEQEVLKDKLLQCEDCQFNTYCKNSFNNHTAIHKGEYKFQCEFCEKKFIYQWSLNQHIRVSHKNEGTQCSHCPRFILAKETYKRHILVHLSNEGFTCDKCQKMYESDSLLARHLSVVHSVVPVRKQMRQAVRRVNINWKHQCNVCLSRFKFKSSLAAHQMFVHNSDDPNPTPTCSMCQRSFRSVFFLAVHLRTHLGEKPYKCSHCLRTFSHYVSLKNHITCFHTKKFKVLCPLCKKGFVNNSKMTRHLKQMHHAVMCQTRSLATVGRRSSEKGLLSVPPVAQTEEVISQECS